MKQLTESFFKQPTLEVAKNLLGKVLVYQHFQGVIVETEAYIGPEDKGCHAYNNKKTPRTQTMFEAAGTLYIYQIYGMYHCLNIVTEEKGRPCAVLIRALKPLKGLGSMTKNRFQKPLNKCTKKQIIQLTNGPGKLCEALQLSKKQNGLTLFSKDLCVLDGPISSAIVQAPRINIDYAEEAKYFPWRFYIDKNPYVSKVFTNK